MWDESRFSIAAGMLCDCRETKPGICGRVEEEMRIPILDGIVGERTVADWKARVG